MRTVAAVLCVVAVAGCGGHAAAPTDRGAAGVRALAKELAHDMRTGHYADACRLATPRAQAALAAAARGSCTAALAAARRVVGDAKLAQDEKAAKSLDVSVSGDRATSPNPESPGETSHYVYVNGQWRIG